jgi:hypothetical protein
MKYLVTSLFISKTGGHVFNPAMDSEVFDCYFSALKWILKEIKVDRRLGWNVELEWNKDRFWLGRQDMLHVIVSTRLSFTHYYVSKINENGFH